MTPHTQELSGLEQIERFLDGTSLIDFRAASTFTCTRTRPCPMRGEARHLSRVLQWLAAAHRA